MAEVCFPRKFIFIYVPNLNHLNTFPKLDKQKKFDSPIWHIHNGNPPLYKTEISFNSLINLVSICNSSSKKVIWGFVRNYDSDLKEATHPDFDNLIKIKYI